MPTIDLTQGPKTLSRYDVVGVRSEDQIPFVIHVGLLDEESQSVEAGGEVSAVHMRPPLKKGEAIKVHVAGRVPLTNDEIKKMSIWLEKIDDEYKELRVGKRSQYIIDPPWKDKCDPNTGVRRYRRYSCAGFVLDSHSQVDIELLQMDKGSLPDVYPKTIKLAYGLNPGPLLSEFGLEDDGPWKVVLAGYVLHALKRTTKQIRQEPYQPKEGDEQF